MYPIMILSYPLKIEHLEPFRGNPYDSMIKYVVDIEKKVIAIGGEMHSDAESVLLSNGSKQDSLWGANIYPWNSPVEIEYTSLINIRPHLENRSLEVQDERIRELVQRITLDWIKIH